jgi:8-hydroxy-5-deazaflavin:NADPH oxidoreductase
MKISIIGDGNVGQALARGLSKAGHSVTTTGNDPARVKELTATGDVVFLAVPFAALNEVAANIGTAADGKPVVDVTNALSPEFSLALGFTTSGAEELQKKKSCRKSCRVRAL